MMLAWLAGEPMYLAENCNVDGDAAERTEVHDSSTLAKTAEGQLIFIREFRNLPLNR
jgi:hypothetical protein